jgi:FtsH-binding integral membrane protein
VNSYQRPASPTATFGVRPAPALVQQLLIGAFGWMFAGLLLTAGVAYLVTSSPTLTRTAENWILLIMIGQLGLGMALGIGINKFTPMVSLLLFFVFAATMGLSMGVIVQLYTTGSVVGAFVSSSAMFAAAAVYGKVTKRDLTRIGSMAFMALIGILVASLVNFFLHSTQVSWLISIIGVGVFVVLTAWHVQRIVNGQLASMMKSAERATIYAAFQLYLDFINLFLFMLRLFGSRR